MNRGRDLSGRGARGSVAPRKVGPAGPARGRTFETVQGHRLAPRGSRVLPLARAPGKARGPFLHFLLASEISMLGTSIPLVMEFAKSNDMHPLLLGMIWTFAAGGKLFAYQSGVLIVGYSYGDFAARDLGAKRAPARNGPVW